MKTTKLKNNKKAIAILAVAILLVVATILLFVFVTKSNTNTVIVPQYDDSSSNNSGSTSSSKNNTQTTPVTIDTSITPSEPTGTFISNHHPNISGSPAPNIESSTCTTTPGANCQIQFTNGSITKSLAIKKTDAEGNASWDWSLSDIGLTVGEWKITAIATNGSKTTTAIDSMSLNVGQ